MLLGLLLVSTFAAALIVLTTLGFETREVERLDAVRPVQYDFLLTAEQVPLSSVVAVANGLAITREDVRLELSGTGIVFDAMDSEAQKALLDRLASRALMAQEAVRQRLDQDQSFLAVMKRDYTDSLAQRLMNERLNQRDEISFDEINQYIEANPQLFEARQHFTFDSVIVSEASFERLDTAEIGVARTFADIENLLVEKKVDYLRDPLTLFSEEVPVEMLKMFDDPALAQKPFVTRDGTTVRIVYLLSAKPAPIPEVDATGFARTRLTLEKRSTMLADVEEEILTEIQQRLGSASTWTYFTAPVAPEGQ